MVLEFRDVRLLFWSVRAARMNTSLDVQVSLAYNEGTNLIPVRGSTVLHWTVDTQRGDRI